MWRSQVNPLPASSLAIVNNIVASVNYIVDNAFLRDSIQRLNAAWEKPEQAAKFRIMS